MPLLRLLGLGRRGQGALEADAALGTAGRTLTAAAHLAGVRTPPLLVQHAVGTEARALAARTAQLAPRVRELVPLRRAHRHRRGGSLPAANRFRPAAADAVLF